MMTPRDHMSHDLSYFSGPRTSGATRAEGTGGLSAPRVLEPRWEPEAGARWGAGASAGVCSRADTSGTFWEGSMCVTFGEENGSREEARSQAGL